DLGSVSPQELRRASDERMLSIYGGMKEEVGSVADVAVRGRDGEIHARLYRPRSIERPPLVVYYHGGGFVYYSVETHDNICRRLSTLSGAAVMSVDYRLAPEHKFPAAVHDAYDAVVWAGEAAEELGVDPNAIAVAGDSAGGNLAAAVSLMARDAGRGDFIRAQVLIYPVLNMIDMSPSRFEFGEGYMLEERMDRWFVAQYLADPRDATNPYASPLLAEDLRGLPPALVVTAEYDPLRDQGEIYAHRLRAAGVPATATRYLGMTHGFIRFYPMLRAGRDALAQIAGYLSAALRGSGPGAPRAVPSAGPGRAAVGGAPTGRDLPGRPRGPFGPIRPCRFTY
ncbi:MAG: alpha/beta hydrolase, partial [Nitrososphaeria archaeon]